MDLRKGSEVKEGDRRCIRCRGRKKLYKVRGGWSFENSGGTLTDCPMCVGVGTISKIPPKFEEIKEEKVDAKKRTLRKVKEAHPKKAAFDKDY